MTDREQEPVAWMQEMPTGDETRSVRLTTVEALAREEWVNLIPLYTAPQRREWVGLTETEKVNIALSCGCADVAWMEFADAIEEALKKKNG